MGGGSQSEAEAGLSRCWPQNKLGIEKHSQDEPGDLERWGEREEENSPIAADQKQKGLQELSQKT